MEPEGSMPNYYHHHHRRRRQCLYSSLLDLGLLFQFLGPIHNRQTPWTEAQPDSRTVPTHRTTDAQNKRTHRHPRLEWDSKP
jgi:hypothetical protein